MPSRLLFKRRKINKFYYSIKDLQINIMVRPSFCFAYLLLQTYHTGLLPIIASISLWLLIASKQSIKPLQKAGIQIISLDRRQNLYNNMETSVSEISISSRIGLRKGNTNASTNQTSKTQDYDSSLPLEDEDSIQRPNRTKEVQARIAAVEQSQAELQAKFEKVIESLCREIAKKDEANALLEAEICSLRDELEEGRKDLGIIVGYLAKRKAKAAETEGRKGTLNSTKASGKLDKSVSGSKGDIELSGQAPREERKNRSPRMLILKKSFKG